MRAKATHIPRAESVQNQIQTCLFDMILKITQTYSHVLEI